MVVHFCAAFFSKHIEKDSMCWTLFSYLQQVAVVAKLVELLLIRSLFFTVSAVYLLRNPFNFCAAQ